jgi:CRP-like cAMP-binding protein
VNLQTWFKTSAMFISEFIEWLYERLVGGKVTISHIEKLTTMVFTTILGLIYFFRLVASFITVLGLHYGVEPKDPKKDTDSAFWDLWFNNLYSMVTTFSTVGYGDNLADFGDVNYVLLTMLLLIFGVFLYGPLVGRILEIVAALNADSIFDEENASAFESYLIKFEKRGTNMKHVGVFNSMRAIWEWDQNMALRYVFGSDSWYNVINGNKIGAAVDKCSLTWVMEEFSCFFKHFDPKDAFEVIKNLKPCVVDKGHICQGGRDPSKGIFLILKGDIVANHQNDPELHMFHIGPGSYFGEKCVINNSKLSTNNMTDFVVYSEQAELLFIQAEILKPLMKKYPKTKKLLQTNYYFRQMNKFLTEIRLKRQMMKLKVGLVKTLIAFMRELKEKGVRDAMGILHPKFEENLGAHSDIFIGYNEWCFDNHFSIKKIKEIVCVNGESYYRDIASRSNNENIKVAMDDLVGNLFIVMKSLHTLYRDRVLLKSALAHSQIYLNLLSLEELCFPGHTDNFLSALPKVIMDDTLLSPEHATPEWVAQLHKKYCKASQYKVIHLGDPILTRSKSKEKKIEFLDNQPQQFRMNQNMSTPLHPNDISIAENIGLMESGANSPNKTARKTYDGDFSDKKECPMLNDTSFAEDFQRVQKMKEDLLKVIVDDVTKMEELDLLSTHKVDFAQNKDVGAPAQEMKGIDDFILNLHSDQWVADDDAASCLSQEFPDHDFDGKLIGWINQDYEKMVEEVSQNFRRNTKLQEWGKILPEKKPYVKPNKSSKPALALDAPAPLDLLDMSEDVGEEIIDGNNWKNKMSFVKEQSSPFRGNLKSEHPGAGGIHGEDSFDDGEAEVKLDKANNAAMLKNFQMLEAELPSMIKHLESKIQWTYFRMMQTKRNFGIMCGHIRHKAKNVLKVMNKEVIMD